MLAIVFDTETTGLLLPSTVPLEKQPKIIELGLIVADDGKIIKEFDWLINPGCEISAEITKITGIKNEDLVGKSSFKELLPDIKEAFSGCEIGIAHNAPFDVGMLKNELKRAGCDDFPWPADIVCTVAEYLPQFGKRPKLTALYEKVMGKPLAQTHRASDDAKALFEVLDKDEFFKKLKGE